MAEAAEACQICLNAPESVFSDLPVEEKGRLARNHSTRLFTKGDVIYREGEVPSGVLCLARGKVKIIKEGVSGREQIIRLAKPVGFIGYRAFFAEEPYQATAIALEDSVVCYFCREEILAAVQRRPELTLKILKSLANELGTSDSRTVNLTQKHIRGRLAESLLFLINTYGFEPDGLTIKAHLSREDLANLSNMTTSNAIRTLSQFVSEGIISLDGRQIGVLNADELAKVSRLG